MRLRATAFALIATTAQAHDFTAGAIYVDHPMIEEAPPNAPVLGGYAWFGRLQTETQPAVSQYMELLDTAAIEMMQTFMRLPALAMLANHRAGRHPLSGIDKLDDLAFRGDPPATQTSDGIEGEDLPRPR